jgi:hypothetical protein
MRKRYITIPQPIVVLDDNDEPLKTENGELKISFPEFVRGRTSDERFGKDMNGIESALSIRTSIKGKSSGELWELDEDDWEKLRDVVKTPSTAYNTRIVVFLVPFLRAITEATGDKPNENIAGP